MAMIWFDLISYKWLVQVGYEIVSASDTLRGARISASKRGYRYR